MNKLREMKKLRVTFFGIVLTLALVGTRLTNAAPKTEEAFNSESIWRYNGPLEVGLRLIPPLHDRYWPTPALTSFF
ncbi:MAG: hypothetical protein CMJ78_23005 [Planctomycetaceae bacterium]|nr:hypothetical protein [Planctomycetaceae bacterium]